MDEPSWATYHGLLSATTANEVPRWLMNLQAGNSDNGQQGGANPETHDDLEFMIAFEDEMVVQRTASNQPFPGHLEPRHLANHAKRLDDEDAANHDEQQFLTCHQRSERQQRAQWKRPRYRP